MAIAWSGACQSNGDPGTYYEYGAEYSNRRSDRVHVRLWVWLRLAYRSNYFSFAIGHECKVNGVYQSTNIKMDRTFWGGWSTYGWAPYGSNYDDMADGTKWHGPYVVFDADVPVGIDDTRVSIIPCITRPCICRGGAEPYQFNYLEKCGWQGETGVWKPWDPDEHVGYWAWTPLTQDGCFLNNYWLEELSGGLSIPKYQKIGPASSAKLAPKLIDVMQPSTMVNSEWTMPSGGVGTRVSVARIKSDWYEADAPLLKYSAHIGAIGWVDPTESPLPAGTVGEAMRLEAIRLYLGKSSYTGDIQVSAHVQGSGWQEYVDSGQAAGTTGQALRLEAVKIKLTEQLAEHFDVYYRAHVQGTGWQSWVKNDAIAGTTGSELRMEAIQIVILGKNHTAPKSDDDLYELGNEMTVSPASSYSFVPYKMFNEQSPTPYDRYCVKVTPYDGNGVNASVSVYSNTMMYVEHIAPNNVEAVNIDTVRIDVAYQDTKKINATWQKPKAAQNSPNPTEVKGYKVFVGKVTASGITYYGGEFVPTEKAVINIKAICKMDEIFDGDRFVVGVQAIDEYGVMSEITNSVEIEYFEIKSKAPNQVYLIGRHGASNYVLFNGEDCTIHYTGEENGSYPIARYVLYRISDGATVEWLPVDSVGTSWKEVQKHIPGVARPNTYEVWELRAYNTKGRVVYSNIESQTWTQLTVYYYGGLIYVYDEAIGNWHDGICYVYCEDGEWHEAEMVNVYDGNEWRSL